MMPSADAEWVAADLTRRFGLPLWQTATTASDANRAAIRWARAVTGRPVVRADGSRVELAVAYFGPAGGGA